MGKESKIKFVEETHQYFLNGDSVPGVSEILQASGLSPDTSFFTEEDRRRGNAVHLATKFLDEDRLNWKTVHPYIEGWVKGYKKFKKDTGFQPRLIEHIGYHQIYRFAGRLDRTGVFPNDKRSVLVDFKTGVPNVWAKISTAGYEIMLQGGMKIEKPYLRQVLQLNRDGTYKLHPPYTDPQDHKAFLCALGLFYWKKNNGIVEK